MSVIKHIVSRLRRRSLKIRIGNINESFTSPDEFVQFLSARLIVPSESMERFMHLDERALQREARKMLHAYKNVIDIMATAKQSGETLSNLWRRLDISKVPDDHDWPSILFALGNAEHIVEDYQREALSNYMHFLDARRKAVDSFRDYSNKSGSGESSMTSMPRNSAVPEASAFPDAALDMYSRLPHSHTVEVDLDEKTDITVFLGSNRYRLTKHGEVLTLKESGAVQAYMLKPGRNTVGRSSQCDVHLDSRQSDISRQHLIVEINAGRRVSLMDVSSRGTYVRPNLIGEFSNDTGTGQQI
ncbi:MAG TPA: FHA domain-containing protein [Gammaproteobacteria bacterium]|nr:FHA domain-containing protein [Gammaproteobacteria bacterium]